MVDYFEKRIDEMASKTAGIIHFSCLSHGTVVLSTLKSSLNG